MCWQLGGLLLRCYHCCRYEAVACEPYCGYDFDWPIVKEFKFGWSFAIQIWGGELGSKDPYYIYTWTAPPKSCLTPGCRGGCDARVPRWARGMLPAAAALRPPAHALIPARPYSRAFLVRLQAKRKWGAAHQQS